MPVQEWPDPPFPSCATRLGMHVSGMQSIQTLHIRSGAYVIHNKTSMHNPCLHNYVILGIINILESVPLTPTYYIKYCVDYSYPIGDLGPVSNLHRHNVTTISWIPPASLDLTDVDPDIVYCVEIYNITCGGRHRIVANCSVFETHFSWNISSHELYEYEVVPRSNVEGAGNGTSASLKGLCSQLYYSHII